MEIQKCRLPCAHILVCQTFHSGNQVFMSPPVVNCTLGLNVSRHGIMNGTEHHSQAVGLLIIPVNRNLFGKKRSFQCLNDVQL